MTVCIRRRCQTPRRRITYDILFQKCKRRSDGSDRWANNGGGSSVGRRGQLPARVCQQEPAAGRRQDHQGPVRQPRRPDAPEPRPAVHRPAGVGRQAAEDRRAGRQVQGGQADRQRRPPAGHPRHLSRLLRDTQRGGPVGAVHRERFRARAPARRGRLFGARGHSRGAGK